MRIWVMDNGLIDEAGHHFNNSVALKQACAARGLETRFLVHQQASREVCDALKAQPTFRFRPYDQASSDALAGPLESLMLQGRAFAEGFDLAFGAGLDAADLVYVPTTLQHEIFGCAVALSRVPRERHPGLLLNFSVENFLAPGTLTLGSAAALYRFAMRELGRVVQPARLLLTAGGKRLAAWLSEVLAHPVHEYPMPKGYPAPRTAPLHTATGSPATPAVAVLGDSRPEKGFSLVLELLPLKPRMRFLLHLSAVEQQRQWQDAGPLVHAARNVEIVPGVLGTDAYHGLLERADIVLLPYDATRLPLRTSGVFSEAVAAAKVVVAPRGTWMGEHLVQGHGAGVTFGTRSVAGISEALETAAARLPELSAYARAAAPAWRSTQCIDAYLERALAALESPSFAAPNPSKP